MTEPDRGSSVDGAQPGRCQLGLHDREVIAAYQQGLTLDECADKFRVSAATVANILKRHGVPRRSRGPRGPSPATRQAVIAAYRDEGLSIMECMDRTGISRELVHAILDGAGIHRDPRRKAMRTGVDQEALATAYRAGLSLRQCSRRFGVCPATVVHVLDKQRVPRRRAVRPALDEAALLARYRTGVPVSTCAREFGISRDTVAGLLNRRGVARHGQRSGVDQQALIAAYRRSLSLSECARTFGISPRTVGRMLDRHNITRPGRRYRPVPGLDVQAVAAAYRSGRSIRECADKFAIQPRRVARLLDVQGVPRRTRPAIDIAALIAAYRDEGLTTQQCANRFGVSRETVSRILRRSEVPTRRGRARAVTGPAPE